MNEQIKELAKQAGVEHTQNCGVEQYYFEQDELEKFAELMVEGRGYLVPIKLRDAMKKNFGTER